MTDLSVSRRLANEPDFLLGRMRVSPSTGRVIAPGDEIRIEALTMAVLVTLARADGATVTRDDLVEECWQGRIVSDDAVARAIAKVRALERCTSPASFSLETVPKIGYRLLVTRPGEDQLEPPPRAAQPNWRLPRVSPMAAMLVAGAGIAAIIGIGAAFEVASRPLPPPPRSFEAAGGFQPVHSQDFTDALLVLDEQRLKQYLRLGWNPNWKLDSEGNAALHNLMMVCERNPSHDRDGVVRVARLLVEAGADPTAHNKWNDTPLIIAATPRYCGPDHPVVAYLKSVVAQREGGAARP